MFSPRHRAHRKFSDEQIKNLGIITRLYQGDTGAFAALIAEYREALAAAPETAEDKRPRQSLLADPDRLAERALPGRRIPGRDRPVQGGAKLDGEDGIIDQDYSLNAGRYVGVVIEDDGMTEAEFKGDHARRECRV